MNNENRPAVLLPTVVSPDDPNIFMMRAQVYEALLTHAKVIPIMVWPTMDQQEIDFLATETDGVFLMGGKDPKKRVRRRKSHAEAEVPDELRDMMETRIVRKALKQGKPILGVCRGLEMLTVITGGELGFMSDNDSLEKESHEIVPPSYAKLYEAESTRIQAVSGTKTAEILEGLENISWRCMHHLSLRKPGENFRISAYSEGGNPEAVERLGDNFVIGILGHIEAAMRLDPKSEEYAVMVRLFTAFGSAVKEHQTCRAINRTVFSQF